MDKNYSEEILAKLIPIFEKARTGDFSENVPLFPATDEFAKLYQGIQVMIDVIREKTTTLETEIFERKRLQNEYYRQKQDFKALADDSPDIIARFDRELRYVYMNPAIEKITGIPSSSFIGKTHKEMSTPEEQEDYWKENIEKVFQTGQEARIEFSYRARDHQIRLFQGRLVPEKAQDESIQYVLAVAHDVTELKQRTDDLEKEQIKDQAILSNIGEGLIVTDSLGRIVLMNQVAEDLLGWTMQEVAGRILIEIVPMEDEKESAIPPESRPEALALTSNKKLSATYYYKKRDNTRFPIAITVTPLALASGVVGSIAIFRDVTTQKELDHVKDQFISLVSHELRTPMTAVKGLVSMALKGDYGEISDRLRQPLTNVYTSAERQIHLINDLLNSSRLQSGRVKYTLLNFSLQKITEEVLATLKSQADQKKITITVESTPEILVQGDNFWVKEVLDNLLTNAIKFTTTGGVTIKYWFEGEQAMVIVSDTGAGISPGQQEKLFGKFEQIITPDAGKAVGSGLGLFIAREVARKLGGDVFLEKSVPEQGSTFVLTLPKADTPRAVQVKADLEKAMELALNKR